MDQLVIGLIAGIVLIQAIRCSVGKKQPIERQPPYTLFVVDNNTCIREFPMEEGETHSPGVGDRLVHNRTGQSWVCHVQGEWSSK